MQRVLLCVILEIVLIFFVCLGVLLGGSTKNPTRGPLTASSWCAGVPPPAASGRSGRRSGTDRGSRLPTPSPHCNTHKRQSATLRMGLVVSVLLRPPNAAERAARRDVTRCDGGLGIAGKCQVSMCHSPQGLGVSACATALQAWLGHTRGPTGALNVVIFMSNRTL